MPDHHEAVAISIVLVVAVAVLDDIAAVDDPVTRPPWGEFGRAFTLAAVGLVGKFTLTVLNRTEIRGGSAFDAALIRPPGVGLVTVSNHTRYVLLC